MFYVLEPKNYKKTETTNKLMDLLNFYKDDINQKDALAEYSTMMNTINTMFQDSPSDIPNTKDVLKFLIASDMDNIFPNMCTLYRIYFTIPVTSASAERSFSRAKLIKNYLKSTMSQERFAGLSLISIERELACNCDYDKIIDNFASMKNRRKKLTLLV